MSLAMYLLAVSILSILAPRTVAQTFDNTSGTATWVAPPIEDVNVGVIAFLAIATVIQLAIVITFPFRVRSQHIAPGIAAIIASSSLFLLYLLYMVVLVVSFVTDGSGNMIVSQQVLDHLDNASVFFADWAEPALFLTIAFIIRDRYLVYDGKERNGESGWPLSPFMIVSYFLVVLLFTLSTSSVGLALAATSTNLSFIEAEAMINDAKNLQDAFVAFYMVATILLIPMADVARKKAGSDKIMNITMFAIIPLLLVRAISRMILLIILSHPSTNPHFLYATDLASSVVLGIPYFVAVCILCYVFFSISLWDGPRESNSHPYYVGGYQQQQQPSLQGGMPPVGQLPGQWGYPGMPGQQQQGQVPTNWSYQTYPLQQGAGGHYPNQQPGQQQYVQQQQPVTSGPGVAGANPVNEKFHIPQQC